MYSEALTHSFTEEETLFGDEQKAVNSCSRPNIKVALVATRMPGSSVVLANYNRDCSESLAWQFVRPERPDNELKIWQAARATSAAPGTFKPILHGPTQKEYIDGGLYHNNTINVA